MTSTPSLADVHEKVRRAFLRRIADIFALEPDLRRGAFRGAKEEPDFDALAELVSDYAAALPGEFGRMDEAEALLDAIEAAGVALTTTGAGRAFDFMLAVGEWSEHEVVALHRYRLRVEPPAEVVAEAERQAACGFDREGRTDFTSWWTCTIDDEHTRDIDDALSIRATMEGGWELAIHIADPAAFVPIGSDVDRYAVERGSSLYLPTATYPMFPRVLSEGAMSLVAGVERPALTVRVDLDEALEVVETRIYESIVRVDQRFTYDEVDEILEDYEDRSHAAEMLASLRYVADELQMRREEEGAVSIELPQPRLRVDFDDDGSFAVTVAMGAKSPSRDLVSEMMILAGDRVARWCAARDISVVYRAQPRPDFNPEDADIRSIPAGSAREFALLRGMRKAEMTLSPAPHAGLGLPMYTQATSPIRRYTDLVVHRQVKAALRGQPLPYDEDALLALVTKVERASAEASTAEREAQHYWLLQLLAGKEGDELEAVVLDERGEVLLTQLGFRMRASLRKSSRVATQVRVRVVRARPRAGAALLRE